jgi:hypothetical protein
VRLLAIDAVALAGAIFATFFVRAAALHRDLLTAGSLGTYLGETLVCAAPAVALAFAAAGLYSSRWRSLGGTEVAAAVSWGAAIALFASVYIGPRDAPRVTVLASMVVAGVALVVGRDVARRLIAPANALAS